MEHEKLKAPRKMGFWKLTCWHEPENRLPDDKEEGTSHISSFSVIAYLWDQAEADLRVRQVP